MAKKFEAKVIKEKGFTINKSHTNVKLTYDGKFYGVYVNDDLYYKSANGVFAMQRFNEI